MHGNLNLKLREIFCTKTEGVAEGWTKLQTEKLHDLYWSLSAGGWWTERQWARWEKRKVLEKFKKNTKFQIEAVKGKGNLGLLGLEEMLNTMWWTGPKWLQFHLLPLNKIQILPSLYQFC